MSEKSSDGPTRTKTAGRKNEISGKGKKRTEARQECPPRQTGEGAVRGARYARRKGSPADSGGRGRGVLAHRFPWACTMV